MPHTVTPTGELTAPFDYQPRTRIVFGVGAVARVGEIVRELGARKILLVTDPGLAAAGHEKHVLQSLAADGVQAVVFDRVHENPTTRDVDACLAVARAAGIEAIIGLGGGSSMDTAKGCNFLLTNGGQMKDYWGVGKATKPVQAATRSGMETVSAGSRMATRAAAFGSRQAIFWCVVSSAMSAAL